MERIKSDDDQISQVGKSVTSEAVKQMKWGFYWQILDLDIVLIKL